MRAFTTADFAHDRFGPGGILAGLREAHASPGMTVEFIVRGHPAHHPGAPIRTGVRVGFLASRHNDPATWRYAGEGGDLDGAGSHALIPTWYEDQTVEHAAATLAYALASQCGPGDCVFRTMPQPQQVAA